MTAIKPNAQSDNVSGKKVLLAAPRGYCAGVDRAVIAVEKALDHYGAPIYVRKQIVHNKHVVASLEKRGAIFVNEVDEAPEGCIMVFSAHGVSPAVVEAANARNQQTIDATCPLVTKVHREVQRFDQEGYDILLVGHEGHEEVEGTAGEAPNAVQLIDGPDGIANAKIKDPNKVIWLSQTTLSVDETMETVLKLREKFPTLQNPPSDDICYATQNRQVAIKKIGAECDLVIVVGSANSSNTVRLVEVALDAGAKASYRVDFASEIKDEWFEGVSTVGVSSGASVPEELVSEVLDYLASREFDDVRTVTTAEEDVQFSLPKELRKDLKAAGHDVSNKNKN
ncbi:MAG: 4-hydroxy-3-methylbut-2-enyl diphosphate reductase [Aquiluna sp.]|nr:4-hydroxy-3-methylbut-2-enyl diphosphate reductase [Aquiluna sp.]MCF8545360.1 4-hydroxy-3-methylbut-2-enyl diphosphate reductase [Aquiluna sp.]